jgi:isocitrate dehydrogenase kinase/phosphatase
MGANDIFPEEFSKFLIMIDHVEKMFLDKHGHLHDVKYWQGCHKR